jgi:DNA-binding MarR family transcriptional regulator
MNNIQQAPDEEVSLLLQLLELSEKLTKERMERALKEVQLSRAKMAALQQLIDAGEPLPLGRLAERINCVKSNATTLLDRLEADGIAERLYEPTDRRTVFTQVTQEGRRRYGDGVQTLNRVKQELLDHYTPDERRQFSEFLSRLAALWG